MTQQRGAAVIGSGLLLALAGCAVNSEATPSPAPAATPPLSMLQVTCEATRTVVSATTTAAQQDGMHVRVTDKSGLSGTYLNYSYENPDGPVPGGGEPVRAGISSQVLEVAPGKVSLDCSYDNGVRKTKAVKVNLLDPGHHFQATTLTDLGCRPGSSPSWIFGDGRGTTADAAVRALLAKAPASHELEPRRAPVDYVAGATLSYVIEQNGRPWATAVVTRGHGHFTADMDLLC